MCATSVPEFKQRENNQVIATSGSSLLFFRDLNKKTLPESGDITTDMFGKNSKPKICTILHFNEA